jgi:hypothetical protein
MITGLRKVAMAPPVVPESMVTIMILEIPLFLEANMSKVEPPLKNIHETKRMMVPKTTKGIEFGSK